jgi:hypothetical protein
MSTRRPVSSGRGRTAVDGAIFVRPGTDHPNRGSRVARRPKRSGWPSLANARQEPNVTAAGQVEPPRRQPLARIVSKPTVVPQISRDAGTQLSSSGSGEVRNRRWAAQARLGVGRGRGWQRTDHAKSAAAGGRRQLRGLGLTLWDQDRSPAEGAKRVSPSSPAPGMRPRHA